MKKHGIRINVNIAHHGTKFKKRGNKRMRRHMTRKRTLKGGTKTRKDLMEVANAWIGHGTYVLEKNAMIVENQDTKTYDDEYIPYDILVSWIQKTRSSSSSKVEYLICSILHTIMVICLLVDVTQLIWESFMQASIALSGCWKQTIRFTHKEELISNV